MCYHEIAARSTVEDGQLSIEAVNALLDQLAGGRLRQSAFLPVALPSLSVTDVVCRHEYVPILRKINQQCTPVEQEWIIRIILKGKSPTTSVVYETLIPSNADLRISIREKGVFSCFHPDAGDLFNVCSDLKRVCWTLYKPEIRLEKHVRYDCVLCLL